MSYPQFSLGSGGNIDLRQTVEIGDLDAELALVAIETFRLTHLISRDAQREGTLAVGVNGQDSLFSWAADREGRLKNPGKFSSQVLYLGEHRGLLDLSVAVVESAEDAVRRLTRVQGSLGLAASIAAILPGPGSLAAGGIGLAGAIVEAFQKQEQDDVELLFRGSIGDEGEPGELLPLRRSSYGLRRNSDRGNDILLVLRVMPYRPLDRKVNVVILLDSIDLELNRLQRRLLFEASLGMGRSRARMSFEAPLSNGRVRLDSIMGIQNPVLYEGPWELGVPFHFSLTTLTQRDSNALRNVVADAGSLARELVGTAAARGLASDITKAVQSFRSMLIEFLPEKKSIGLLSGHFCSPASVAGLGAAEQGAVVQVEDRAEWQKLSLEMAAENVGRARVNLRVKGKG